MIDLRVGRWENVLRGEVVDAVVCDPPYGRRTHEGAATSSRDGSERAAVSYDWWAPRDVRRFVDSWHERTRGWIVALTSDDLVPAWRAAYRRVGRLDFAPVACVIRGMTCRIRGDGPSSWVVYAMVARPRTAAFAEWGTLPGAYVVPSSSDAKDGRGKPEWLEHALVRDYSRAGDLVCDPCAGYGGTLSAAVALGRRGIGAEVDEKIAALAHAALRRPIHVDMFGG